LLFTIDSSLEKILSHSYVKYYLCKNEKPTREVFAEDPRLKSIASDLTDYLFEHKDEKDISVSHATKEFADKLLEDYELSKASKLSVNNMCHAGVTNVLNFIKSDQVVGDVQLKNKSMYGVIYLHGVHDTTCKRFHEIATESMEIYFPESDPKTKIVDFVVLAMSYRLFLYSYIHESFLLYEKSNPQYKIKITKKVDSDYTNTLLNGYNPNKQLIDTARKHIESCFGYEY
jgi:hypothetical protein